MTLASGAMFPMDATCETTKASSQMPDLEWAGEPAGTKSFAIVFIDTSLTTMGNTNGYHWAIWNIGSSAHMLPQGLSAGSPPAGLMGAGYSTIQQKSPLGMAFLGPCPNFPSTTPTKTDSYAFQLYALSQDSLPSNTASMSVQQIQSLIEGLPPLGKAVLTATSNAAATMLK
jgi:phosphatidylethanolamine-binding protein (PEBP) family uncharacterized protein